MNREKRFILWFDELGIEDVPLVGGKNASLGEMYRNLTKKKVNVPNGFAITAYAYRFLLEKAGIADDIKRVLRGLNTHNVRNLAKRGEEVRRIIRTAIIPLELAEEIKEAYKKLSKMYKQKYVDVAVRSSATAEDLPDASFAGQQETYLNIQTEHDLMMACKKCFASLFTNRAISYRVDKGFDHFKVALSIGVQKMVRSDLSSSGVMFSVDTESGFKDAVFVTSIYGLGENIVQGAVNPDEFYVHKPTLRLGYRSIISKKVGSKRMRMIYANEGNKLTKNVSVPQDEREKYSITDNEILTLAKWAVVIEEHYSKKAKKFKPMDMEWAKDGQTGQLFIVQARPETVVSQKDYTQLEEYELLQKGKILVEGRSVGSKIGGGKAHIIKDVKDISKFKKGEVLITEMTDPDWEPIMKIASAIVTNRGGRTCFSGDTTILTDKGFMTFKEIEENGHEGLLTLSLNKDNKKIEWKPIIAFMKRKARRMKISVSQSGRVKDNSLTLTPDHRMINVREGEIVKTEISEMIRDDEMVCLAQRIPEMNEATEEERKLAYLLGGILTDGSIYRSRTHGEVQFIQKDVPDKQGFIQHMNDCMVSVYGKSFVPCEKRMSSGFIRGNQVRGQATAHRLYSKEIAYDIHEQQQNVVMRLLEADSKVSLNFLAGVIDGDGCYYNNRINIYIGNDHLLQAATVACLKLGIMPQVTKNRTIYNMQIVEKIDEILKYTKRVKGKTRDRTIQTRFFGARQVLNNDVKGQLKLRRDKNLYVSDKDLEKEKRFESILQSDIRMQRVIDTGEYDYGDVYNITVAGNHNYVVFSERLTPVIACNCHAAIISREMGIPCIVGTNDATSKVRKGQKVTIDTSQGDVGYIYDKLLKFRINRLDLKKMPETRTKIMMNLGNPEQAFELSHLPHQGIGLAREEFIINSYIKIHPKALINYDKIKDKEVKSKIDALTIGYEDKRDYFIDKLAYGVATIAAANYPNDVILRFSDFKTNEYANLIGGREYEPEEDNPMIGWRGASRYYRTGYRDGFELECKAIKRVRDEMGLTNLKVMVPFCRTVEEGEKVLTEMKKNGLQRGKNWLKVYVMCEIPSNVILAEEFCRIFDGFSIGSNDLTQLTLGLDRDSEIVSDIYDERNMAVKLLIAQVVRVAKAHKKKIGICGDAPSTYPEFAEFLVEQGIDSLSLSPDAVIKTMITVAEKEKKMKRKR